MAKVGRKRVHADHAMTAGERVRRSQDKLASIDRDLDEAIKNINWERRKNAETSFYNWVCTYGYPQLLQYLPPKNAEQVLNRMELALNLSKPQLLMLSRGQGKSIYSQLFILYQICTLRRRFPVIISANARASTQLLTDIFRFVIEEDTPFSQDYPTLSLPFQLCNGAYRRRQIYKGKPTGIYHRATDMGFADVDIEGQPKQAFISARSITGGLRGMRVGSHRVDSVLLDDLLNDDDITEETTNKLLGIINQSVMNLGGQGKKLSCIMTATPLAPDDLTQVLKKDKGWSCVEYPSVIQFGDIETDLWKQYWDLYDTESIEDRPHEESDCFYKQHQEELEKDFILFNPDCYTKGENVSGVQYLMQKRRLIGEDSFASEYLLKPKKFSVQVDVTAKNVLEKIGSTPMLTTPQGTQIVVSSWDLNVSHALTNTIVSFDSHMTATILYHEIYKCHISSNLPETEYHQKVYELLTKYGKKVASLGLKIDYVGIDAGGANFNPVCDWTNHSIKLCGLSSRGFVVRASHMWNGNVRSKLRSATGRTVLCGDEAEHLKSGSGKKWVAWDADAGKMAVLKAVLVSPYGLAGLMLYNGTPNHHQDFATQLTNEKLLYITHQSNGKDLYNWKTKSAIDHDYLDTVAQAYAVAWSCSLGTDINGGSVQKTQNAMRARMRMRYKPRIRIV